MRLTTRRRLEYGHSQQIDPGLRIARPERTGMRLAGIEVDAISIGGVETCIELPEAKLAFDIGRCPHSAVNRRTVLFTHAHMDHLGGVAYHCATRALRRLPPPRYVIGRENAAALRELFEVWRRLDRSELENELVEIGPGEELRLDNGWYARPFRSPHRAPCQGYGLWSRRKKLLDEHVGRAPAELARMRASGTVLEREVETAEFAFTGDTLIDVVEKEAVVREARLLVMEVTFLDERVSVAECRSKGHVHLDEVAERAELFRNEALLFTHFSARYRQRDILKRLDERLPPDLRARVTPLLSGHAP
jgi:ribonuclease Z